jgi:hypothetical protein
MDARELGEGKREEICGMFNALKINTGRTICLS